jgi:hypothetical protein
MARRALACLEQSILCAALLALSLLLTLPTIGHAQDWRAALETEKADNARQIAAIDRAGNPVASQLRAVNQQVATHNASPCTYPQGHPEQCASYEREAATLNAQQDSLRTTLQGYINQRDRLVARNQEIERRLHCAQPPVACSSNADCTCSGSCARAFDGARYDALICQPRP